MALKSAMKRLCHDATQQLLLCSNIRPPVNHTECTARCWTYSTCSFVSDLKLPWVKMPKHVACLPLLATQSQHESTDACLSFSHAPTQRTKRREKCVCKYLHIHKTKMEFFSRTNLKLLCVKATLKNVRTVRSEVLAFMRIHQTVCRDIKPCSLVDIYQTTRLHTKNLSSWTQEIYAYNKIFRFVLFHHLLKTIPSQWTDKGIP
jgi:hypothetical protein